VHAARSILSKTSFSRRLEERHNVLSVVGEERVHATRSILSKTSFSIIENYMYIVGEDDEDRHRRSGREALSREVALDAAASRRLAQVHGVEPLWSKFWASGEDSDDLEKDEADPGLATPSTTTFINDALDAGFTIEQLAMAEQALDSGKSFSPTAQLPKAIVSEMVRRKLALKPWKGPLPGPRVSPPRTLGDYLAMASRQHTGPHDGSASTSRRSGSSARPMSFMVQKLSNLWKIRSSIHYFCRFQTRCFRPRLCARRQVWQGIRMTQLQDRYHLCLSGLVGSFGPRKGCVPCSGL
jgi:hypothetical protein